MIAAIKGKLRAWLIDLVREAIRIERLATQSRVPFKSQDASRPVHPVNLTETISVEAEWSFEQMQAVALKAQEEFYEPKRA